MDPEPTRRRALFGKFGGNFGGNPVGHLFGPIGRGWESFRAKHLHDYSSSATRLWLTIALAGALAILLSGSRIAFFETSRIWQIIGWTAIALMAAAFPLHIPRTKYSIVTGDIVVFLLLALHGPFAASLAAGLEGLIGSRRTSRRVSSNVASLCGNAAAMLVGGAAFVAVQPGLRAAGLPPAAAHLGALAMGAMIYLAMSTTALMQILYLKRGMRMTFQDWFGAVSWVGTLYLVAAVLAGLLSLNAQQFGQSAAAVGVLIIGVALALLHVHFKRQSAEHEAQEARVAAAQAEAEQNQQRFHSAFTHASIGMAIVSSQGRVLQVNQALCGLLGYADSALTGRPFRELLHPGDASLLDRYVEAVRSRREESFSIELRCVGADQGETWVSLHCALFDDTASGGKAAAAGGTEPPRNESRSEPLNESPRQDAGLIYQLHDITSRRRAEGELHHIAYHDSLTDLANRNCFQERLRVAVDRSRAERRFSFAVMYLDLDRFKVVNDSLGHPAGDELLKEVGRRLSACVRPKDLVARLGGDEFAILLEDTLHHDDALRLGERLLQALDAPAKINGTEIRPQASIGVTFGDLGYREPNEILRDADIAMYKAKGDGKNRLAVFDASLHEQLGHKLQLEADLRRAIGEGQLSLVFQPLYELEPFRLTGFEALTRWEHPLRGNVRPDVFISLAEESGCIEALTQWAIDEAVAHLARWRQRNPRCDDLLMHVNVSGRDLSQEALVPHVRDVLDRHGLPAHLLTLEITESTLMKQRELALRSLDELGKLGVRLGIDDFGTGYSSLAYLSTLPFDCLKIDRSFVTGMQASPQNVEIVRTVLSLGRTLQKQVIAEGIETPDQLELLKRLGAPVGQGYLLARPLKPTQVNDLLEEAALAHH